jgi:paraquat-inducible protein B
MENNKTYFKIGLFILAGLAALIGGVLYINADVIRGEAVLIETYLNESVQGLSVGSEVLYRGVTIGQVKEITFVPVVYDLSSDKTAQDLFGRYVMVVMAIKSNYFPGISGTPEDMADIIAHQVDTGLRFKLSYQGITGIVYMEADYINQPKEPLDVPWQPQHLYVPSTPSLVTSFTTAVEKIFQRIENIEIEALFSKMEKLLDTTTRSIEDAQIAKVREDVLSAVNEFSLTNQQIRKLVEEAQPIPADFRATLQQFEKTLVQIELTIQRNEPDLEKVLSDMKDLVRNIKRFSEDLKNDPAQILFSRPPKPSERVQ